MKNPRADMREGLRVLRVALLGSGGLYILFMLPLALNSRGLASPTKRCLINCLASADAIRAPTGCLCKKPYRRAESRVLVDFRNGIGEKEATVPIVV